MDNKKNKNENIVPVKINKRVFMGKYSINEIIVEYIYFKMKKNKI